MHFTLNKAAEIISEHFDFTEDTAYDILIYTLDDMGGVINPDAITQSELDEAFRAIDDEIQNGTLGHNSYITDLHDGDLSQPDRDELIQAALSTGARVSDAISATGLERDEVLRIYSGVFHNA